MTGVSGWHKAKQLIQAGSERNSARSPKFDKRNTRIKWLVEHYPLLEQAIVRNDLHSLVRKMMEVGLYSKKTQVRDILAGFPNLINCVKGRKKWEQTW